MNVFDEDCLFACPYKDMLPSFAMDSEIALEEKDVHKMAGNSMNVSTIYKCLLYMLAVATKLQS